MSVRLRARRDQLCRAWTRLVTRLRPCLQASTKGQQGQKLIWENDVPGYHRTDAQFLKLSDGGIAYANYTRTESTPVTEQ